MREELWKLENWIDEYERHIVGEWYGRCIVVGRREMEDGKGNEGLALLMTWRGLLPMNRKKNCDVDHGRSFPRT